MTDTNPASTVEDNTKNTLNYSDEVEIQHHLDTQGLICPEPVMMLHRTIRQADSGDYIEILATDPATTRDIPNFCRHLGHTLIADSTQTPANSDNALIKKAHTDTIYRYVIQKKR